MLSSAKPARYMGVAGVDLWEMAEVRNRLQSASTSLCTRMHGSDILVGKAHRTLHGIHGAHRGQRPIREYRHDERLRPPPRLFWSSAERLMRKCDVPIDGIPWERVLIEFEAD